MFAGPILISTDVFSYIAYARMGVEHGLNPYLHGPVAIVGDPVFRYVGHDWSHVATAYGPIYTLLSYPLAPLGVVGALWGMKLEALFASAGMLALTWRCARARDLDPALAILAVGANPLYVIYGLGGAHNDLIMMLAMMAAVSLTVAGAPTSRREATAAALVVAGALVKATVAALLPFMILSRGRSSGSAGADPRRARRARARRADRLRRVRGARDQRARRAEPRRGVRLHRQLRHRDRAPVRQAGRVPVDHDLLKGAPRADRRAPAVADLARL